LDRAQLLVRAAHTPCACPAGIPYRASALQRALTRTSPRLAHRAQRSRGTFWGDNGWFRIERGVNSLLVEGACSSAVPTYDGLEYVLGGALGGGPKGLAEIKLSERWSHRPTHSDAPPGFYAYEGGAFVRSARLPQRVTTSVAPAMAAAFALALAVSAFAAGVAVTRRKVRRELDEAREGLRAAILQDDRM
jgi:hypothetical protein